MSDVLDRTTNYLSSGGLVNPELMEHEKVRDLIMDYRDEVNKLLNKLATTNKTIEVLEKSNEFYSDRKNYLVQWNEDRTQSFDSLIEEDDFGICARQAKLEVEKIRGEG